MIFFSRTDDGEIDPWSWHGGENIRAPHVTDAQHTTDTHAAPAVTEKHIMTLFKEVHYKGDMLRWPYGCGGQSFESYLAPQIARCLLYTSPSPRDIGPSRMPSSA